METEVNKTQSGFRKGRGTRDHIFNLRNIIEKFREIDEDLHICYIDYSKAFDCVIHKHLWKTLRDMGIHNHHHHHHHQVPDLEQTLATMPLQTSLSSDNFKKFKPLLCPPVAELQRLSRNVIRCLPLSRLPSTLPVKDKNSKPLRLHTCPKNSICLFLIVFNSDL